MPYHNGAPDKPNSNRNPIPSTEEKLDPHRPRPNLIICQPPPVGNHSRSGHEEQDPVTVGSVKMDPKFAAMKGVRTSCLYKLPIPNARKPAEAPFSDPATKAEQK